MEGAACEPTSSSQPEPIQDNDVIQEGDMVIFDINSQSKVNFVEVKQGSTFKFGRGECDCMSLRGHRYGTLFELGADGKTLCPIPYEPSLEWCAQSGGDDTMTRDNRAITDIKTETGDENQELSQKDIETLKDKGLDGSKIVDALVSNSKTFEKMSELAQKKYKKRKVDKYVLVGCAQKPTAATLAQAYYTKQASRIGHLRPDTLALLLCMANVGPYQNVLVLESSSGLVTGAVAERLGGYGEVCAAHYGRTTPGIAISNFYNFNDHVKKTMYTKSLLDLLEEVRGLSKRATYFQHKKHNDSDDPDISECDTPENAIDDRKDPRFTSCIITSTNYCVKSALIAVMPLLAPSATFAVASPVIDPLADCMNLIRVKGYALSTSIQEVWMRDIQVLPKRTHPAMNMTHGGGYILTGTVSKRGRWVDLHKYRSHLEVN